MNLAPRWVDILRRGGIEASHWSTIGRPDASDAVILDYAARNAWVVLTHDLDFGAILAASKGNKPSVVQVRADDLRPEHSAPYVMTAIWQTARELEAGALVTVDTGRTRIRILPLDLSPK
jgi:predicted nuclease of predicted toxin-antitoxin system